MVRTTNTQTYTTVDAETYSKEIKSPDVYLIDVRTPEEYKDGHIAGAHNLDVENPNFLTNAGKVLPRDRTIAVYCGTGKRSGMASEELSGAGYRILNLDGGLNAWEAAGLPIEK